jgi:sortase A
MRDKRPVDELSIEELERILAIRKREARQERLRHFGDQGRRLPTGASQDLSPGMPVPPQQHEAAENLPPVEPPVTYDITDDVPRFEDDLDEDDERPRKRQPPIPRRNGHNTVPLRVPRRRAGWDKMLLGVEMLALTGIAAVLVVGGNFLIRENKKIDELEQKSAAIQQEAEAMRPTLTPAPELRIQLADYVLPGGHYSPVDTGGSPAFNLDELPESVRPAAQAQLLAGPPVEFATPMPISAARVEINTPKVQVNGSIYGGDDWYALQKGVGHLAGSANPGERGNVVLTAHNDIYGEIFRDIQYLEPGDEVYLYDQMGRRYRYVVYDKQIVKPSDVWVLQRGNEPIVTLITCHPYRVDTRRMVVFARLQES